MHALSFLQTSYYFIEFWNNEIQYYKQFCQFPRFNKLDLSSQAGKLLINSYVDFQPPQFLTGFS